MEAVPPSLSAASRSITRKQAECNNADIILQASCTCWVGVFKCYFLDSQTCAERGGRLNFSKGLQRLWVTALLDAIALLS